MATGKDARRDDLWGPPDESRRFVTKVTHAQAILHSDGVVSGSYSSANHEYGPGGMKAREWGQGTEEDATVFCIVGYLDRSLFEVAQNLNEEN